MEAAPFNSEELLRFELWKEQADQMPLSDEYIHPFQIAASDNSVQVDHILPWSRFGDDSFHNKTLCLARENQQKKDRTSVRVVQGGEIGSRVGGVPRPYRNRQALAA